jgi:hypothetical protein
MSITNDQLLSKVVGIIASLEKLPTKELALPPMVNFAEDYNKTRKLFLELNPSLDPVAPPEVEVVRDMMGDRVSGRYVEVLSYTKQLQGFLRDGIVAQRKG